MIKKMQAGKYNSTENECLILTEIKHTNPGKTC